MGSFETKESDGIEYVIFLINIGKVQSEDTIQKDVLKKSHSPS